MRTLLLCATVRACFFSSAIRRTVTVSSMEEICTGDIIFILYQCNLAQVYMSLMTDNHVDP